MGDFCMPSLGADMDTGTIVEWLVQPGDVVHRGDIMAVVDTEKSDIEVEVFEDGVVEQILVPEGQEVEVGTPLARIGTGSTTPPPSDAPPAPPPAPAPAPAPAPPQPPVPPRGPAAPPVPAPSPSSEAPVESRRHASPLARRRAQQTGIDLAAVKGSGPAGAVVAADVASERSPDRRADLRRSVGALMARSKREIPHYYLDQTIDLGAAIDWLTTHNAERPVASRVLPAALLLRAVTRACETVPTMNGHFVDDHFVGSDHVHLGVAISLRGGGLIAPAMREAEHHTVDTLMGALGDLVERGRAGRLRGSELTDPTITVTNLGDLGADRVYGVIYPPQVAIVGFGRILDRPMAVDGMLTVRPTVAATLAADHRVSDGRDGSRFLATIEALLQRPEDL